MSFLEINKYVYKINEKNIKLNKKKFKVITIMIVTC